MTGEGMRAHVLAVSVTAASIGALRTGFDLGVLNPALQHITDDLDLNPGSSAFLVTLLVLAAALGAAAAGQLADSWGLISSQVLVAVCSAVASFLPLVSGPWSYTSLAASRVLSGIACGACTVLCPRYLAEISPRTIRGLLSSLTQVAICAGILLAFVLGLPYSNGVTDVVVLQQPMHWWQAMFLAGGLMPLCQILLLFCSEESPVWTSRYDVKSVSEIEPLESTPRWHGHGRPNLQDGDEEAQRVAVPLLAVEPDRASVPLLDALFRPRYRRQVIVALGLSVFQQLGGINAIIFYSDQILYSCGLRNADAATAMVGLVNLLVTLIAAAVVDRIGRKMLWIASYLCGGLSLLVLGVSIAWFGLTAAGPACAVCMMLFVASFAIGAGPVTWIYLGEVLHSDIKGPVQAFVTAINWIANSCVAAGFPLASAQFGLAPTMLFFAAMNLVAVIFGFGLLIETNQRSLEEIHAEQL